MTSEEITESLAFEQLEPSDMWLAVAFVCYCIAAFSPMTKPKKWTISDFYLPELQKGNRESTLFQQAKATVITAAEKNKRAKK